MNDILFRFALNFLSIINDEVEDVMLWLRGPCSTSVEETFSANGFSIGYESWSSYYSIPVKRPPSIINLSLINFK